MGGRVVDSLINVTFITLGIMDKVPDATDDDQYHDQHNDTFHYCKTILLFE
jgi:hypothetical protein